MPAVTTQTNRTARIALNNGTDAEGNTRTVNISLTGVSKSGADWDADKYLAIVAALEPCLSKNIVSAQTVVTYDVAVGS